MVNDQMVNRLRPYEGIIRFVVAMLAANYFWKFTVIGDEAGHDAVTWFGLDLTWFFDQIADHIAGIVYTMLQWFDSNITLTNGNRIRFLDTGVGVSVVWGCTGVKQAFIWMIIMLAARGQWGRKLAYIPVGWLFAYAFNIFRIFMVSLLTRNHPEWFEVLHTYIFKYMFYGCFFLLWLLYDEYIAIHHSSIHQSNE